MRESAALLAAGFAVGEPAGLVRLRTMIFLSHGRCFTKGSSVRRPPDAPHFSDNPVFCPQRLVSSLWHIPKPGSPR